VPASPPLRAMWELCALEPFDPFAPPPPGTPIPEFPIRAFIPLDPPDGDLRIAAATCEPCPPGEVSDANGQCSPCPLGSVLVGNACSACPPGTTSQGNECVPCPGGIVIDNVCESLVVSRAVRASELGRDTRVVAGVTRLSRRAECLLLGRTRRSVRH